MTRKMRKRKKGWKGRKLRWRGMRKVKTKTRSKRRQRISRTDTKIKLIII